MNIGHAWIMGHHMIFQMSSSLKCSATDLKCEFENVLINIPINQPNLC